MNMKRKENEILNNQYKNGIIIGLIGTGKIGGAIVTGYSNKNGWNPKHIYISSRSKSKSIKLQEKFPEMITIEDSNQKIIDKSDIIFIGLLPEIAKIELPKLTFNKDKKIISMMAVVQYKDLLNLLGKNTSESNVIRTVPLPSSADRMGPILAYPTKNKDLINILKHIGEPVCLDEETKIITLTSITSMISYFYAMCGHLQEWCIQKGTDSKSSRSFIRSFFSSLAQASSTNQENFLAMAQEAATPGGLNEQVHKNLTGKGTYEEIVQELEIIYKRLHGIKYNENCNKRLHSEVESNNQKVHDKEHKLLKKD